MWVFIITSPIAPVFSHLCVTLTQLVPGRWTTEGFTSQAVTALGDSIEKAGGCSHTWWPTYRHQSGKKFKIYVITGRVCHLILQHWTRQLCYMLRSEADTYREKPELSSDPQVYNMQHRDQCLSRKWPEKANYQDSYNSWSEEAIFSLRVVTFRELMIFLISRGTATGPCTKLMFL